ncbi:MAG TPA: hypothetical protein VMV32_12330 [Ignavibacteriaceae bacterium]|nr:hypothetical protein [Ignavibacteriaceae bacterium]
MNGQTPIKKEWKEVAEEVEITIHNLKITLNLLEAQLKEARTHTR